MRLLLIGLAGLPVVLGSLLARADKDGPAAADVKKCTNLIDDARNLAARSKLPAAIAKLEACVALVPDDAIALGELGFAAYQAKDYAKAEAATRKAIAAQPAPNIRGALFYNLGLIQEATKHAADAIASYSESLRARPNATVRAALRVLDAKAAEAFDPYQPVTLAGPVKSVDAFCKTLPTKVNLGGPDPDTRIDLPCTCGKRVASAKVAAPYAAAEVFVRRCGDPELGSDEYRVAVEVGTDWYIGSLLEVSFMRRCSGTTTFPVFAVEDLIPGGQPELRLESADEGECRAMDNWKSHSLYVIGLGASKVPSMTPAIPVKRYEATWDRDAIEFRTQIELALELTWSAAGLEVKGKTTGLDKTTAADLLGKHALAFP